MLGDVRNWFGAVQSCYIEHSVYSSGCLNHFFMGNFMLKNLQYVNCGSCLFFSHFCRYYGPIIVASKNFDGFRFGEKDGIKTLQNMTGSVSF